MEISRERSSEAPSPHPMANICPSLAEKLSGEVGTSMTVAFPATIYAVFPHNYSVITKEEVKGDATRFLNDLGAEFLTSSGEFMMSIPDSFFPVCYFKGGHGQHHFRDALDAVAGFHKQILPQWKSGIKSGSHGMEFAEKVKFAHILLTGELKLIITRNETKNTYLSHWLGSLHEEWKSFRIGWAAHEGSDSWLLLNNSSRNCILNSPPELRSVMFPDCEHKGSVAGFAIDSPSSQFFESIEIGDR